MFSTEYTANCIANGNWFAHKLPQIGDWYADMDTPRYILVSTQEDIDSHPRSAVFIPDLDDLFQLIRLEIETSLQASFSDTKIDIEFSAEGWKARIELSDGRLTLVQDEESLHLALFKSLPFLASLRRSDPAAD